MCILMGQEQARGLTHLVDERKKRLNDAQIEPTPSTAIGDAVCLALALRDVQENDIERYLRGNDELCRIPNPCPHLKHVSTQGDRHLMQTPCGILFAYEIQEGETHRVQTNRVDIVLSTHFTPKNDRIPTTQDLFALVSYTHTRTLSRTLKSNGFELMNRPFDSSKLYHRKITLTHPHAILAATENERYAKPCVLREMRTSTLDTYVTVTGAHRPHVELYIMTPAKKVPTFHADYS